ncbi:MAG: DUF4430 domain-containing protein [Marinisporobacter sp.]|jgi:hypothetical protein|nr:DUF4430 domain-containing protein [Marinisporobacter sp.]
MKKVFSIMLVLTLVVGFAGVQAFAAEEITDITFADSRDFMISDKGLYEEESLTLVGLVKKVDGSYKKVKILDKENIKWTTTNPGVVKFYNDEYIPVGSISGKETVTAVIIGGGKAKIHATYRGMSVYSNVTVKEDSNTVSVNNINMELKIKDDKIQDKKVKDFKLNIEKLDNFSLKDIYGQGYNDSGVKKDKVTALHAFLFALELKYDSDGCTRLTDPAWDWDWVSKNVKIGYNGSFVQEVGSFKNYGMTGWMYKVNNNMPMYAASQYELKSGDSELWFFGTWGKDN